jgi:Raf kinase inhibitor-like YbhB/YbcL family protein
MRIARCVIAKQTEEQMRRFIATVFVAALAGCFGITEASAFDLKSSEIKNGGKLTVRHVFNGFGCTGENHSPALTWNNPPAGTKSFVVTMYDPDAPTGSGWWHWVVANIPADAKGLPADAGKSGGPALPAGAVQARTDFGAPGYGGPCPPPGKPHRYIFTVRALKTDKIDVGPDSSGALVGFMARANTIASAKMTLTYGR